MIRTSLAASLTLALAPLPGLADEVWHSDMGDIVYLADQNGAAVLSFTNVDGTKAELVIPGLAGNWDHRGVHDAFWIGTGAGSCDAFLARPGGTASTDWGQAVVSFDYAAFPTAFTMTLGHCFGPLSYSIRAEPR